MRRDLSIPSFTSISDEDDFDKIDPSEPLIDNSTNRSENCARKGCDKATFATYFLTLLSLITVGTGAMGVGCVPPYDNDASKDYFPALPSLGRYLIPAGVFVYSFIFNWDRRPPELVQLFLEIAKVRSILLQALKHEIKDESEIRKFVALLRNVIATDGPAGEWFYDRTSQTDKWESMRVHSLYLHQKNKGCDLYLMSEFDNKHYEIIENDAVILTNNNTAYFILNGKITMEDGKPQAVNGINRQNLELTQSVEPIRLSGGESKKWKIFKEAILKGGHIEVIDDHLRDRNKELRKKLKEEFSREQDHEALQIIANKPLSDIPKKQLERLLDMVDTLILANQNYLSPSSGPITKKMNHSILFRCSVFLFVTGSMLVTVMMSLNLSDITTRFINHYWDNSVAGQTKAMNNAAIIIFVSPVAPGMLALWAQLNTIPAFQYRTGIQRLLRSIRKPIAPVSMGKVLDLGFLGFSVGLLITQPRFLDSAVLIGSSVSYYAAQLLTSMIPNIFKKCLRKQVLPLNNNTELTGCSDPSLPSSAEHHFTVGSNSNKTQTNYSKAKTYLDYKLFGSRVYETKYESDLTDPLNPD